jgi:hypothetical protein
MARYAPMWRRLTFLIVIVSPSRVSAVGSKYSSSQSDRTNLFPSEKMERNKGEEGRGTTLKEPSPEVLIQKSKGLERKKKDRRLMMGSVNHHVSYEDRFLESSFPASFQTLLVFRPLVST